jgi:type II secretory pathway pseudopilin PulG
MVMVICAVLAASSMLTIQTDIQIAVNERIYHEALMSADAGIQWLRTQNLATLSGFSTGQLNAMNATNATIGAAQGIRFTVPQNPTFAWADPTAGGAPVFLVRSRGADRGQRVTVDVEAEIRMAPGAGAVEEAGCITCYP